MVSRLQMAGQWWRGLVAVAAVLVLALSGVVAAPGVSDAQDADGGQQPGDDADGSGVPVESYQVTLVTGDVVLWEVFADGTSAATVDPVERDGPEPDFEELQDGEDVYVIPSDVAVLAGEVLDRELFNVAQLVAQGYHDEAVDAVPVIIQQSGGVSALESMQGLNVERDFDSIDASAAAVAHEDTAAFGEVLAEAAVQADADMAALSGVDFIGLDSQVTVELHDSVEQTGAPSAWDAGFDGEGVTVAVLDTGIDESHADIGDKVVAAENFSSSDTTDDLHGHGTHVAATAAGSGEASDGDRTGVAPGADLVNAKVLGDTGSGTESEIIAGMEWAADDQAADVVNMSLGGGVTDGTDPMSQAVDALTAEHGTVFVVSAGNDGPSDESVTTPGTADAAITVGAVDKDSELASFSSRGPRSGDFAITPDVTAPGVDIVAARADGTEMGEPVDDDYTEASGTSMAAPHAAGAAAIALQQHPDFDPGEVTAVLAGSAAPHGDLTVYEEGAGELDIAAAVETDIIATPAPLDLGYFQYPHDNADPVTETLTYTNHGDELVTLDLDLELADEDGEPAHDELITLGQDTVTVDAGQSATVDVTADVTVDAPNALYSGHITASSDGDPVTHTATGLYKEPEMHNLTIQGIARDGSDATGLGIDVMNVDDRDQFFESNITFTDGVAEARVPPGNYSVMGTIITFDESGAFFEERVMVGDPELEVTEDTELELDAREANEVSVDTMHDEAERTHGSIAYHRAPEEGTIYTHSWSGDTPVYAAPIDPVTQGDFEFYTEHQLTAPELVTRGAGPDSVEVDASYMLHSPELDDGDYEWPLVEAGLGLPEDLEDTDVEGAAALMERGGPGFAEKAENAADAGAEAAIIYNDAPGRLAGSVGEDAVIPTFQLSQEEGHALVDLAEEGDARFEVVATPVSSFFYDLLLPEPDAIPEDLHYEISEDDVATVPTTYHTDVADRDINVSHANWRPYQDTTITFTRLVDGPLERVEYISAGDTRWRKTVYAEPSFDGGVLEPVTYYDGGQHREKTWHKGPAAPALVEGNEDAQAANMPMRDGDTLDLEIAEWSDAQTGISRHWGWLNASTDQASFRLYEDGEEVATAERPEGEFEVSSGPSRLRMETDVSRDAEWWLTSTETETAWEFDSAFTADEEPLPLVLLDYDIDLDLYNTAPHPRDQRGPFTIDVQARHARTVDGPEIAGLNAWVSYDDGETWRERSARDRGDGRYEVTVDQPAGHEYVSLRVEAWDADGNTVEQEIIRAYALAER